MSRERRHAFAFLAALIPAMGFLGSLIAGILPGLIATRMGTTLEDPTPYRLALWLAPVLCWLGMLPLIGSDPGRIVGHAAVAAGRARPPLMLLAFWGVVVFLSAIGEGAVRTFFNVYLDTGLGVAPATIGFVMGIAQLLPIAVALLLPLPLVRWGTGYTLVGAILAMSVFLLPIAIVQQVVMVALAYMGACAAFTANGTARDLFGQELVIPRWRTSSQAVAIMGMALGWSAAGVVGGVVIEAAGFGTLYASGAAAALLAGVLLLGYLRTVGRRQPATVETAVAGTEL